MDKESFITYKVHKSLLLAIILFIFSYCANSQENINNELDQMEEYYFHHTFDKEQSADRVQRLEKQLFGSYDSSGSIDKRVSNLYGVFKAVCNSNTTNNNSQTDTTMQADTSNTKKIFSEQKTKQQASGVNKNPKYSGSNRQTSQTYPQHSYQNNYNQNQTAKNSSSSSTNNYPIVSKMEMKVFHQEYTNEPLNDRLDRLELKLYGTKSSLGSLNERVENLKSTLDMDSNGKTATKKQSDWMTDDELEAQNMNLNNNALNSPNNMSSGMGNMNSGMGNMNSGMSNMSSGMGNMSSGMGNMNSGMSNMSSGMGNMNSGMGMNNSFLCSKYLLAWLCLSANYC